MAATLRCSESIAVLLDNLRSDIKQDDADAANNYVTYHGQNFVVGEEDYNADVFADDSTAKLVIKANGSARIGDADGGIQMDQNSNVSINLASPELLQTECQRFYPY